MNKIRHDKTKKEKRQARVRAKVFGTAQRPRLSVYRSNKHISLQIINDELGKTLASASDTFKKAKLIGNKTEKAGQVATELLKQLKTKKINNLVFDRSFYKYHGRVKKVAEVLREGGIKL
jgi:large subunit ribosomal protein L18